MKKNNIFKNTIVMLLVGTPMVLASVPRSHEIANDAALYQSLHELRIKKVKAVDFDSDIARLSAQEKSHRDDLPMSLTNPMERIQKAKYSKSRKHHSIHKAILNSDPSID